MSAAAPSNEDKYSVIESSLGNLNNLMPVLPEHLTANRSTTGINILDLKNTALLVHVSNILALIKCKINGRSIENSSLVENLLKTRVILERIRPLELKLKYQIERILKLANQTQDESSRDKRGLQYKPNLANLIGGQSSVYTNGEVEVSLTNSSELAKDFMERKKNAKYIPPKLVPMPYNHDEEERERRREQRELVRKYHSSAMREMRDELSSAPREASDMPGVTSAQHSRAHKLAAETRAYEEEFMTRLPPASRSSSAPRGISEINRMVGAIARLKSRAAGGGKRSKRDGKRSMGKVGRLRSGGVKKREKFKRK